MWSSWKNWEIRWSLSDLSLFYIFSWDFFFSQLTNDTAIITCFMIHETQSLFSPFPHPNQQTSQWNFKQRNKPLCTSCGRSPLSDRGSDQLCLLLFYLTHDWYCSWLKGFLVCTGDEEHRAVGNQNFWPWIHVNIFWEEVVFKFAIKVIVVIPSVKEELKGEPIFPDYVLLPA